MADVVVGRSCRNKFLRNYCVTRMQKFDGSVAEKKS